MKLVRFGPAGKEKPGLIDADGKLRDLVAQGRGHRSRHAGAGETEGAREARREAPAAGQGQAAPGPCVTGVSKFLAIGLNYADHAAESNMAIPEHPIVFYKSTTCIVGPERHGDDSQGLEGDRLGGRARRGHRRTARHVAEKDALRHVAGYCLINDVSEREFQLRAGRRAVEQGQGLRHLRPARPLARHHRRDHGPAEPRHVAGRQRRAQADRQHPDDDLRRRPADRATSRAT